MTEVKEGKTEGKTEGNADKEVGEMSLGEMYRKFEKEDKARVSRKKDKMYGPEDVRNMIKRVFVEAKTDVIRMNVLVSVIKEADKKFKDLKYQEVRSYVKSKGFEGYELYTDVETGIAMVRKV